MANGLIQLSPEELLSQSTEMSSLQAEYENLFSGVGSILGNVNESWSPNLANNFVGKIGTAKNAFSNLIALLQQGAALAANSAKSFTSADQANASLISGAESLLAGMAGTGIGSSGGGHSGSGRRVNGDDNGLWKAWEDQVKAAGEGLDWLDEQYDKIPESIRKRLEELIPDDAEAAWRVTKDIIRGDYDWDTLKDAFVGAGGSKDHATIVTGLLSTLVEQASDEKSTVRHLEDVRYELSQMMDTEIANGHYGQAFYDGFIGEVLVTGTEGLYVGFKGTVDIATGMVTKAIDGGVNLVSDAGKTLGYAVNTLTGWDTLGNGLINASETISKYGKTATSTLKQVLNVETATQFWADKLKWW